MKFDFDVSGFKTLNRQLANMNQAVEQQVMKNAIRRVGNHMKKEIQNRVSVDTGDLKRSIKVEPLRRTNRKGETWGVRVGPTLRRAKGIGVWWAHIIELGSKFIAPRPYIRPAFEANKHKIVDLIKEHYQRAITSYVKRTTKKGKIP